MYKSCNRHFLPSVENNFVSSGANVNIILAFIRAFFPTHVCSLIRSVLDLSTSKKVDVAVWVKGQVLPFLRQAHRLYVGHEKHSKHFLRLFKLQIKLNLNVRPMTAGAHTINCNDS